MLPGSRVSRLVPAIAVCSGVCAFLGGGAMLSGGRRFVCGLWVGQPRLVCDRRPLLEGCIRSYLAVGFASFEGSSFGELVGE